VKPIAQIFERQKFLAQGGGRGHVTGLEGQEDACDIL